MQSHRVLLTLLLTAIICFPLYLFSEVTGPEPRRTGGSFPGERSCATSDCHGGLPNTGPGSVSISVNGMPVNQYLYQPGETAPVVVSVSDPSKVRWGFELTARSEDGCLQAGRFSLSDASDNVQIRDDTAAPGPCPEATIQFPMHLFPKGGLGGASYELSWTAPASEIGPIVFAAAGNAANGNNLRTGDSIYTTQATVQPAGGGGGGARFVSVSSASFAPGQALAGEVIAAGFGSGLATGTAVATETPLPTDLLGTSVQVTDSQGVTRAATLFFVSAGQINYLIPEGTALGTATIRVNSGTGAVIDGTIRIDAVAPSVYSANSQGTGVAAASFLRVNPDNSRTPGLLFDPATGASVPVDISPQSGQLFLLLFGTGFRGFQNGVTATVGGQNVPVLGAVPQGEFVGLDQINIGPLPAILGGGGEVDIVLTADGKTANTVAVNIQ